MKPIDLTSVLATFDEPWSPRTLAVVNDYDVRVAKTRGEFPAHSHPDTRTPDMVSWILRVRGAV